MRRKSAWAIGLVSVAAFATLMSWTAPAAGQAVTPKAPAPRENHRRAYVAPKSLLPPAPIMASVAQPYSGAPIDVTTYHYDNNRTGWNATETDLTAATVASNKFGLLATLHVDGNVLAQPLLVSNFVMPNSLTRDVLIVATGHNSVYAFDAKTFARLWHVNLGPSQSSDDLACIDVFPEYGISSTPVILRTAANTGRIYVVSATEVTPSGTTTHQFQSQLHMLNLANGHDMAPPVVIAPSATLSNGATVGFDPANQWNRAGLAYNDGKIYVGIGSHCDNNSGAISGWLLQFDRALHAKFAFHTIETPQSLELASIWMSGFAPAISSGGSIYVVTGNGALKTAGGAGDYGESVLKLSSAGVVESRFTPIDFGALNFGDVDFGSGGVMLAPPITGQTAPPLAVAIGKDGILYLLNQMRLGGAALNDKGALQATRIAQPDQGVWGGPAYYNGPNGPTVFLQMNNDVLRSFSLNAGTPPSLTASVTGTSAAGFGGSIPIVSSNGATAGTGVVWLIRRSAPMELEAYDATKLGAPIFSANIGNWSNTLYNNGILTPMEANGHVYVPGYLTVRVFGLSQ